jgi:hypothetical protein
VTRGRLDAAIAIGVVLFAALVSWPLLSYAGYPQDEGILLVAPERILNGAVPQRDFLTLYGPGCFWVLAAAFKVFGPAVSVERSVGLVYHVAIPAAIFLLSRPSGRGVAIASAVVSVVFLTRIGLGAFAWAGAYAALLWAIVALAGSRVSSRRVFLAGLLGGIAGLFRLEVALVAALVAAPLLVRSRSEAKWFLAGLATAMLPLAIHVGMVGPRTWLDAYLGPTVRILAAGHLPIPPPDPRVEALFWLVSASAAFTFGVGVISWSRHRSSLLARLGLSYGLLVVALIPHVLQRADEFHLIYVGAVTVPFMAPALMRVFAGARASPALASALAISVTLAAVSVFAPRLVAGSVVAAGRVIGVNAASPIPVENSGRAFPLTGGEALAPAASPKDIDDVRATLSSVAAVAEGGRLIVGPRDLTRTYYTDTYFYFLLPEFTPGTYYLEMIAGAANGPDSRLADELTRADVLVLTARYDAAYEEWVSALPGDRRASDAVDRCFDVRASHGDYQVLTRRSDAAERGCRRPDP